MTTRSRWTGMHVRPGALLDYASGQRVRATKTPGTASAAILRWLPVAVVVLLGGCSSVPPRGGGYYQDDGPPAQPPVDVSKVPDAVPRTEPLSASGNKPYAVFGVSYTPMHDARGYRERGIASWYGRKFHGRRTSSGETYDMYAMTAAHRTLPLPSYVRVHNLENGRSVVVRVNDRGPFLHNRLIDLSYTAAARLGFLGTGTAMVEVETVEAGTPRPAAMAAKTPEIPLIPAAHAAAPAANPPRLSVQVGAFGRYENAVGLKQRLELAGFTPVYILSSPDAERPNPLYRVRIGPVPTVARGDQLAAEVASYGVPDALLVVD